VLNGCRFLKAPMAQQSNNSGLLQTILNSPVNFTYPTLPQMEAVLVAKPGSTLAGGAFSASATIVISLR
ncbi:fimbrial protein, partial [Pseudomonas bubulae]